MAAKRVLVIDDEPDVLTYLVLALKDHGFEPIPANSAALGLALIESERPDLVCIDILMPRRTGLSLYKTIKESPDLSAIPVIIVSGLTLERDGNGNIVVHNGDRSKTFAAPEGIIEKPVDLPRFIETARALTGLSDRNDHAG